jgi:shikimate 5-dehydrogenase
MAQLEGNSSSSGGRLNASLQKTTAVVGDFVLGAGWGGTATAVLLAGSTDQAGTLTITASATTPAQATATVVHTFKDGAYKNAPHSMVIVTSNSAIDEGHVVSTTTTTAGTWTFSVLPVATKIYVFKYLYVAL